MNLLEQLKRDEGVVPYAYEDSLGYWTIGVGFLIDKRKGGGLDDAEIDFILHHRLRAKYNALVAALPWLAHLDDVRMAALQNMAWQIGVNGVLAFKNMIAALEQGDWAAAKIHALDSRWAKQTPERANRVAEQLCTGEWQ